MKPAGWYPDPAGQPDLFRFWDGHAWTPVVTRDANTPLPTPDEVQRAMAGQAPGTTPLGSGGANPTGGSGAGAAGFDSPGSPPSTGGSKMPIILGSIAGALVLVLALVLVVLRPGSDPGEPSGPNTPIVGPEPAGTAKPPPDPTEDGGNGGENGPIQCDQGNATAVPVQKGADSETGGAIFTLPTDYGFRLNSSQFPYLNDVIAYMPKDKENRNRGIVAGGLPTEAGFGDRAKASRDIFECIPVGLENSSLEEFELGESTETTLGEFQATKTTAVAHYGDSPDDEWTVHVVDTGQQGSWALFITFHPAGDTAAAAEVQEIIDSVH